jgi:hypothetical protein
LVAWWAGHAAAEGRALESRLRDLGGLDSRRLAARAAEVSLAVRRHGDDPRLVALVRRLVSHAEEVGPDEARTWVPLLFPVLNRCGLEKEHRGLVRRLSPPKPRTAGLLEDLASREDTPVDELLDSALGLARLVPPRDVPRLMDVLRRLQRRAAQPETAARIANTTRRLLGEGGEEAPPPAPERTYINRGPLILELRPRL